MQCRFGSENKGKMKTLNRLDAISDEREKKKILEIRKRVSVHLNVCMHVCVCVLGGRSGREGGWIKEEVGVGGADRWQRLCLAEGDEMGGG